MATPERIRGRPRERRVDDAIRRATLELLEEVGYRGLSIEAVAARAGVGKPTIYRRFSSKPELVFAHTIHPLELGPAPDTGSLRGDLTALLDIIFDSLLRPAAGTLPGLLDDLAQSPELAERFRARFVEPERRWIRQILERALARGEVVGMPDLELAHALLVGPVFSWIFLARNPVKRGLTKRLADHVARALQSRVPEKENP